MTEEFRYVFYIKLDSSVVTSCTKTDGHAVIFITAPYAPPLGQEMYCNMVQSACVEHTRTSQIKYTSQGCAYDCVHTLMYM